jgi:triphosphoribosyl-dephospho-CoA synthase
VPLAAYLSACEIELRAFKPGNVSVYSEGHDMTVHDFTMSASVSGPCLVNPSKPLGERIYDATLATHLAVGCNTNLGIILLAAPILLAYELKAPEESLEQAVARVLQHTTISDAEWTYRAIRIANPGGLGSTEEADVSAEPNRSLLDTMRLAAHRDSIARQYTCSFYDIFHTAFTVYDSRLAEWESDEWAAVAVFSKLLQTLPDSHIERKFGTTYRDWITDSMTKLDAEWCKPGAPSGALPLLRKMDRDFKSKGLNPGTTADLTVACLLAHQLHKG